MLQRSEVGSLWMVPPLSILDHEVTKYTHSNQMKFANKLLTCIFFQQRD